MNNKVQVTKFSLLLLLFFCLSKIFKVGLYQYQRLGYTTYFKPKMHFDFTGIVVEGMNVMSCRNQIQVFSYFGSTQKGRLLLPNAMAFPIFTAG